MSRGPLAGLRVLEFEAIGPGAVRRHDARRHGRRRAPASTARRPPTSASKRERRYDVMHARPPLGRARPEDAATASRPRCALVERADALIEGFRPGVMERLGLGPDALLAAQPAARLRPHDRLGPGRPARRSAPATTSTTSRSPACCTRIGRAGEAPVPPLNLVGDFGGGGMLLALRHRLRAARGAALGQGPGGRRGDGRRRRRCWRRCSAACSRPGIWSDERGANMLDTGAPFYDVYETTRRQVRRDRRDRAAVLRRAARAARPRRRRSPRPSTTASTWPRAARALRRDLRAAHARRVGGDLRRLRRLLRAGALVRRIAPAPARRRRAPERSRSAASPSRRRRRASIARRARRPSPPPERGRGGAEALADWGFDAAAIADSARPRRAAALAAREARAPRAADRNDGSPQPAARRQRPLACAIRRPGPRRAASAGAPSASASPPPCRCGGTSA